MSVWVFGYIGMQVARSEDCIGLLHIYRCMGIQYGACVCVFLYGRMFFVFCMNVWVQGEWAYVGVHGCLVHVCMVVSV